MSTMPIPEKAKAKLKDYIATSDKVALAYNETLAMIRLVMDVPEDYVLHNVDVGFEPPPEQAKGQE